jgi:hypothetical protein
MILRKFSLLLKLGFIIVIIPLSHERLMLKILRYYAIPTFFHVISLKKHSYNFRPQTSKNVGMSEAKLLLIQFK